MDIIINPLNKDLTYDQIIYEILENRRRLRNDMYPLDECVVMLLEKDYEILRKEQAQYTYDMTSKVPPQSIGKIFGIPVLLRGGD